MRAERGRHAARVLVEKGDRLVPCSEGVGLMAFVAEPRKAALPVGSEQGERIPPFASPRIGDVAALEHDVVDTTPREPPARGKACLAGADDDRSGAH